MVLRRLIGAWIALSGAMLACSGDGGTGPEAATCTSNDDCGDGQFCSEASGMCQLGCQDATECNAGLMCQHGRCMDPAGDLDGDGFPAAVDCDDLDATIYPFAPEQCNGRDDDCDGEIDEGLPPGFPAQLQAGVCEGALKACGGKDGWVEPDYTQIGGYEATEQSCDGLDNDCDGAIDEGLVPPPADYSAGVCAGAVKQCEGGSGWQEPDYTQFAGYETYEPGDCDGIDSNCDGQADDHRDGDGDGYYTPNNPSCVALYEPQGHIDCDDENAEFNEACVLHVAGGATGLGNGKNWANAFTTLQDALATAKAGYQIWVAAGVYRPDTGGGKTAGDRNATFVLKPELELYGGFAGTETSLSARDWRVHQTTLSGDLNGDDGPGFTNVSDNSYHVVRGELNAVLDGFWIVGGNANGSGDQADGGGVFSVGPSDDVTVRNCTFHRNRATSRGGALYSHWSSPPTIINTRFIDNYAAQNGGAVFTRWSSAPHIYGCLFAGNSAGAVGGAVVVDWSGTGGDGLIINSTFVGNSAPSGDAIGFLQGGKAEIINSVLWGNGSGTLPSTGLKVSYSCLQGSFLGDGNKTLNGSPFVNMAGSDGIVGTLDDNLRLASGSTCINAGHNASVPAVLALDLDGKPRIQGSAVDLGAYEIQ